MKALIVDDSRAIRTIQSKLLRELGFQVSEACHGKDALERLAQEGCFDLALVDWNMPEMNGFEFLVEVRQQPVYSSMRIVMVTTEAEMSRMETALEAGADEYVFKPFNRDIMVSKLALLGITGPA